MTHPQPISTNDGVFLALRAAAASGRGIGYLDTPESSVSLVENKAVDWQNVERFLTLSARVNHWTNFGPIHDLLAEAIHAYLELPDDLTVVPVTNGTIALELVAKVLDIVEDRPLRWVGCAFSFPNLTLGHFAGTHLVDCDTRGLLAVSELQDLSNEHYDGIVVTNPLGLAGDIAPLVEFARRRRKQLILDNAAGFGNRLRGAVRYQAISFHQTKTFGIGEGGCAILPAEHRRLALDLISFAKGAPPAVHERATNGKLSEFSAALILDRLHRAPEWVFLYQAQAMRIRSIAGQAGLVPLYDLGPTESVPTSIPFVALREIPLERLANPHLTLAKYYRPLSTPAPNAHDIFQRVVSVPCHPDVRHLDADIIGGVLTSLVADDGAS